jgi:hypothetical protein
MQQRGLMNKNVTDDSPMLTSQQNTAVVQGPTSSHLPENQDTCSPRKGINTISSVF